MSASALGVRTVVASLRPFAGKECIHVEGLRRPACQPLIDQHLKLGHRRPSCLIAPDQVADIVADVAIAPVATLVLDPCLHLIHGPQSPSVLYNMPYGGEMEGDWVRDCIAYMRKHAIASIEPAAGVEAGWSKNVDDAARQTLFHGTDSWYSGANIEGKIRQFVVHLGGPEYFKHLKQIAQKNYEGFVMEKLPMARNESEARGSAG